MTSDSDGESEEVSEVEPGDGDTATDPSDEPDPNRMRFVVVTFNTGTSKWMAHDREPDDGYTSQHGVYSDEYYGDGLAWTPAVEATRSFFAEVEPDIVVFQEIFFSDECENIPAEARQDFVCESWQAGDPTVANLVLGEGYQVMCHPGKNDKCAAVKREFGTFRGCDADFCLEGMDGYRVEDCGRGARVGRGVIDLADGGTVTLVNFHGTSGFNADERDCRVRQVEQVFVDLGDGEPGVNGERNLVMGDLNTDPGRLTAADPSAVRWNDFVGDGEPFHFISEVGRDAPPTYANYMNIDHVIADVIGGSCWAAGVTEGNPDVIEAVYFDHKPVVCVVEMDRAE